MKSNFVRAKVTNPYITEGQVYKIEGYDKNSNSVLIPNVNFDDPNVFIDLPMEMFEEYESQLIYVDFRNKRKAA